MLQLGKCHCGLLATELLGNLAKRIATKACAFSIQNFHHQKIQNSHQKSTHARILSAICLQASPKADL